MPQDLLEAEFMRFENEYYSGGIELWLYTRHCRRLWQTTRECGIHQDRGVDEETIIGYTISEGVWKIWAQRH